MTAAKTPTSLIRSVVALLPRDDVDTDQIIPARYLTVVDKRGLADGLFANWRDDSEFFLNRQELKGAAILLAGANFGCGSSREHAVWALMARGFRAIVARSFGDIFNKNAHKNGLLTAQIDANAYTALSSLCTSEPATELTIDLERQQVIASGQTWPFTIDPFARHCLLTGLDELDYLLSLTAEISRFEAARSDQP